MKENNSKNISEREFWQGIGNMVVEAIRVRDYPLIQGYVIWMAVIYVMVNLFVDLFYQFFDPKIRMSRQKKS